VGGVPARSPFREAAQSVADRLAGQSWFLLSWVPSALPSNTSWDDMDFDPAEAISRIRCPVLAFYGEDEGSGSREHRYLAEPPFSTPARLTIHELPGTEHHPTLQGGRTVASISPAYPATLIRWLNDVLRSAAQNQA
jgi:pimeloyl-ACP methyl ester carboxylesterase